MSDVYHWNAVLDDGGEFPEFDVSGRDHGFGEIDPATIDLMELIPQVVGPKPFTLSIPEGATATFFRRRKVQEDQLLATVTMVGYRSADEQVYYWCFDDGTVMRTTEDNITL